MIVVVGLRNCRREVLECGSLCRNSTECVVARAALRVGKSPVQELRSQPRLSALSSKELDNNTSTNSVVDGANISTIMTLHSRAPILINIYQHLMTAFDITA